MRPRTFVALLVASGLAALAGAAPGCLWTTASNVDGVSTRTCTFQGMDTACGKCVARACRASLDAICIAAETDYSPEQSTLQALDKCASSPSADNCGGLNYTGTGSEPTANDAVHACVTLSCGAECQVAAPDCAGLDRTSACGKCIASACVAPVGACCVRNDCSTTFGYINDFISQCITNAMQNCTAGLKPPGMGADDQAVLTCVDAHCKSECTAMIAPSMCQQSGQSCDASSMPCCTGLTCLSGGTCGTCTPIGDGCDLNTFCCSGGSCDMSTQSCL